MRRFAGFELDEQRAELRGPAGAPVRLRPKTFEMLRQFASNPGRVIAKEALMEAVWPSVHVSEDSLFQCVRELRAALGDDERKLIKVVSGRGYLFDATVTEAPASSEQNDAAPGSSDDNAAVTRNRLHVDTRARLIAAAAGLAIILSIAAMVPSLIAANRPPTLTVNAIVDASGEPAGAAMAAAATRHLTDGFARVDNIRVVAHYGTPNAGPGLAIDGQLSREASDWTLTARLVKQATGEVHGVASIAIDGSLAAGLVETRLAAGVGDVLARSLNGLLEGGEAGDGAQAPTTRSKVAIEQATAAINQTNRERFGVAEAMLKDAFEAEPDNVDLQVALAALQLRGIQMVWYQPEERAAVESSARSLLEHALEVRPRSMAVLEAQCRFLSATNAFAESLVACGQALSFDPWNGSALYLVGLGQIYLGRFEDALATFELADRYDTPPVSRWTWLLGAGWANLLLGRSDAAVPWLERSIAITPASGRSHMALAVAYSQLGRDGEARSAMARGLDLRPGSTALNVIPPTHNASPVFLAAHGKLISTMVALGLPDS